MRFYNNKRNIRGDFCKFLFYIELMDLKKVIPQDILQLRIIYKRK